jgi:hypothetical protein
LHSQQLDLRLQVLVLKQLLLVLTHSNLLGERCNRSLSTADAVIQLLNLPNHLLKPFLTHLPRLLELILLLLTPSFELMHHHIELIVLLVGLSDVLFQQLYLVQIRLQQDLQLNLLLFALIYARNECVIIR